MKELNCSKATCEQIDRLKGEDQVQIRRQSTHKESLFSHFEKLADTH